MLKNLIGGNGPPVAASKICAAFGPWTWNR
jgi:hypothetical protein